MPKKLSAQVRARRVKILFISGDGALCDAVEFILKAQGKWEKIAEAYIGERSATVQ